jgi:uncharacterized protein Smg (DUF494 family)
MPFENTKERHVEDLKDLSCAGLERRRIASRVTWLEQLSINSTETSSANPSNVWSSARWDKSTVQM